MRPPAATRHLHPISRERLESPTNPQTTAPSTATGTGARTAPTPSGFRDSSRAVLDGIDRALEDHRRLAARVAFDRLFAGWDTRGNEEFAERWAAECPEDETWMFGVEPVGPRPEV